VQEPDVTPTPRDTLARLLELLLRQDLGAVADMYAEDGVHELPFPPPGAPRRIDGREQIRAYFATLSGVPFDFREFSEVAVHDTTDPEVLVAEYDAHGTIVGSGREFTFRYLWVLRVSRGQIVLWRDYWNPGEVVAAQGG
jgi:uncharacterized protein